MCRPLAVAPVEYEDPEEVLRKEVEEARRAIERRRGVALPEATWRGCGGGLDGSRRGGEVKQK